MSLFKRPSWAQVSPSADHEETEKDIFSHSDRLYQEIAVDQRRQRKLEEREKNQDDVKDEQPESPAQHTPMTTSREKRERGSTAKRRRITAEEGDGLLKSLGLRSSSLEDAETHDEPQSPTRERSPRIIPKEAQAMTETAPPAKSTAPLNVIELSDDSDTEPDVVPTRNDVEETPAVIPRPPIDEDEEDSDPEIAELQRQARLRRSQDAKTNTTKPSAPTNNIEPSPSTTSTTNAIDPVINLFISSPIPDTQPLLVHCRLSQRLQDVRENWCQRQPFAPDFADQVFLIHRLHRVYNSTTGRSLGLAVDAAGRITKKGAEGKDGVENVHLEAVTEELFRQMKAQRAASGGGGGGGVDGDEMGNGEDDDLVVLPPEPRQTARVTLRAKDRNELKIKVQPTTIVSKLIQACRGQWAIGEEQDVWLEFDGDRLDPDAEMQDTEVEDLVTIDVYIK